jgi:hypothetical protein
MTNCLFDRQAPCEGFLPIGRAVELHKSIMDIERGNLIDLRSLELQPDDVDDHEHGGYSCGDRSLLAEKG